MCPVETVSNSTKKSTNVESSHADKGPARPNINDARKGLINSAPSVSETTPLKDIHFKRWLEREAKAGSPEIVKRFQDGTLSKNDLDVFVGLYKRQFPQSHIRNVERNEFPHPKPCKEVFSSINIAKKLPPLNAALAGVTLHFGSDGVLMPVSKLNSQEKALVADINKMMRGQNIGKERSGTVGAAISQISGYCRPDSEIVQFQLQRIVNSNKSMVRFQCAISLAKSEGKSALPNGETISNAEKRCEEWKASLDVARSRLPKGAFNASISKTSEHSSIIENGGMTLNKALEKTNQFFKIQVMSEFYGGSAGPSAEVFSIRQKLRALPESASASTILKIVRDEDKATGGGYNLMGKINPLLPKLIAAQTYLKNHTTQGLCPAFQIETADRIMAIEPTEMLILIQRKTLMDQSITNQAKGIYKDPSRLARLAEEYVIKSSESRAAGTQLLTGGLMVAASAGAVSSGQVWALPLIWAGPLTLASATRAYVEDKSLIEAASKEWRLNKVFGSPGSVLGEHLKDPDSAWKLFLLDVVALAAVDLAPMASLRAGSSALKFSKVQIKTFTEIAKSRGVSLGQKELNELTHTLGSLVKDSRFLQQAQAIRLQMSNLSDNMAELLNPNRWGGQQNMQLAFAGGPPSRSRPRLFGVEEPRANVDFFEGRKTPKNNSNHIGTESSPRAPKVPNEVPASMIPPLDKKLLKGFSLKANELGKLEEMLSILKNENQILKSVTALNISIREDMPGCFSNVNWSFGGGKYHLTVSNTGSAPRLCFRLQEIDGKLVVSDVQLLNHADAVRWGAK